MHVLDIMTYGNQTLMNAFDQVPRDAWDRPGACGYWSTRQILAHMVSYELLLGDVLQSLEDGSMGETLQALSESGPEFNNREVAARASSSVAQLMDEYRSGFRNNLEAAATLDPELWTTDGVLAWYGAEYDLEDYVVYSSYGHKREHSAQIHAFVDIIEG